MPKNATDDDLSTSNSKTKIRTHTCPLKFDGDSPKQMNYALRHSIAMSPPTSPKGSLPKVSGWDTLKDFIVQEPSSNTIFNPQLMSPKNRQSTRSAISKNDFPNIEASYTSNDAEISREDSSDYFQQKFHTVRRNSRVNIVFTDSRPKDAALKGLIHPDNKYRIWWDWLMMIMLFWILVVYPINLAFAKTLFQIEWLELLIDVTFLIDVVLQFFTSFRHVDGQHAGRVETSQREVVWTYLRSWFVIDLLASLPIQYFMKRKAGHINRLLKVFRSIKLMRILRISRIYNRFTFRFRFNKSITRVTKLVLMLILEWHWIASFYWIVATYEGFEDDSKWLPNVEVRELDLGSQYLRAFFWAINCTTGVGDDIVPKTNLELIFTMVVIVFGVLTYASIVGSVATALSEMDTTESQRFRDLENIEDYLSQRNCSERLKKDILTYYAYCYDRHVTNEDNKMLEGMHSTLKEELDLEINKGLLQTVPRFAKLGEAILLMLVRSLRSKIYLPGEIVYLLGEQATEMYFVVRGNLEEIDKHGIARIAHTDGSFFGDELFSSHGLRTGSVQSMKYSELLVMHHDDMIAAMRRFPIFAVEMATWNDRFAIEHLSGWSKLAYCWRLTCLVKRFGANLSFDQIVKITNGIINQEAQNLVMQMTFQQYLVNYGIAEPLPKGHNQKRPVVLTHNLRILHDSSDEASSGSYLSKPVMPRPSTHTSKYSVLSSILPSRISRTVSTNTNSSAIF